MGGGYISCGQFCGDDKSGSAISGVFEAIPELIPEDARSEFISSVLDPLADSLEENGDYFLIEPEIAALLLPPVDALYMQYGNELGNPEPFDAPEIDEDRGLDTTEAKWGKGIGWRYYCLHDLRIALRKSIESKESVVINFD